MTTLLAKTCVIPVVTDHCFTCAGHKYTVETPEYIDTVTVSLKGDVSTCTCKNSHCEHIRAVERRRYREALADARHAVLAATFDLSYGDGDAA